MENIKKYKFVTDSFDSEILNNQATITGCAMAEGDDTESGGFTQNAIDEFLDQVKTKKIFIDSEHLKAFNHNVKIYLDEIIRKTGVDEDSIKFELNKIMNFARLGTLPIAKIFDAKKVNGKLELVTKTNPSFSNVDSDHKSYYNAFMNSLKQKFIDAYSVTFSPKRFKFEDGKKKIDSLMVHGVTLTGNASHANTRLTAVAYRCANELPEVYGKKELEVRMATDTPNEDIKQLIEQNKQLMAEIEANKQKELDLKKLEEETKRKTEEQSKIDEQIKLKTELETLKKQNEDLERQAQIYKTQNTTNANSKRLAVDGKDLPPTDDNKDLNKKVSSIMGKLDRSTVKRKPNFSRIMRRGDIIVDENQHFHDLAHVIQLQCAGKTNNLRKNVGYLGTSKEDVITPALNR